MNKHSYRIAFLCLLFLLLYGMALHAQEVILSGSLQTETGQPIRGARVILTGTDNQETQTATDGTYSFVVQATGDYEIKPCLAISAMDGSSAIDLTLLSGHLDGSISILSPYALIAADIDQNYQLNLLDFQLLRERVLNDAPPFPRWRFIPKNHVFTDPGNPLNSPFPSSLQVSNPGADTNGLDFTGFNIGDLNGSAIPAGEGDCETEPGFLHGRAFFDENADCLLTAGEPGLKNWLISFNGPTGQHLLNTDTNGFFRIALPEGNYEFSLLPANEAWNICSPTTPIFISPDSYNQINLGAEAQIDCPVLEVDLSTPSLQPCLGNWYYIRYHNAGTQTATGVQLQLEVDPMLEVVYSTLAWSQQNGNQFVFPINDLAPGESGQFQLFANVSCLAEEGRNHCLEARLLSNENCLPVSPSWDGASLELHAECQTDSLYFTVKNIGSDMGSTQDFIVIEDEMIMRSIPINLPGNDSLEIAVPANGSTYRIAGSQTPDHPGRNYPSLSVEGCGLNESNNISLGFVKQYPQNDDDPFVARDCQESFAYLQANRLQVQPHGYGSQHWITDDRELEFLLQWQNQFPGPIRHLLLLDTLPEELDPTTFRIGASSHPVNVYLLPENVLAFEFIQLDIPNQNTQDLNAQLFVKFGIYPKPDLPIGSLIENEISLHADQYPGETFANSYHTIGVNFIQQQLLADQERSPTEEAAIFAPNPFLGTTQLICDPSDPPQTLILYRSDGSLFKKYTAPAKSVIQAEPGLYWYQLHWENGRRSAGKLIALKP